MDVTKPYGFIGFGAMDVTKPYGFIWFVPSTAKIKQEFGVVAAPSRGSGGREAPKIRRGVWGAGVSPR